MGFYSAVAAPAIFRFTRNDPEPAHRLGIIGLKALGHQPLLGAVSAITKPEGLATKAFGLTFDTPVGIAAGFDKHGEGITGARALGVGHIEVGTIVPQSQEGNARPRLQRDVLRRSLRNWYGFNSVGMIAARANIEGHDPGTMKVGINVGANKTTPIDRMHEDYVACIERLYDSASYFTINISSPNTPGLRGLQEPQRIDKLLYAVSHALHLVADRTGVKIPYVVKIANDLPVEACTEVAAIVVQHGGAGIIVGNTRMVTRDGGGAAGESGPDLFPAALDRIEAIKAKYPQLDLVCAGGLHSPELVLMALRNGATLCQIYTAMIYEGPFLFHRINKHLRENRYRQWM